jgi:hypothetical protein
MKAWLTNAFHNLGAAIIVLWVVATFLASGARANTYHTTVPQASPQDAIVKTLVDGGEAYRCRAQRIGPNINAVAAPGSFNTFHASAPGSPIEALDAVKLMAAGKPVFNCRRVQLNPQTGRLQTL